MSAKLLTEHNLEFLSLKGGCTGSSESTLIKMPHCWKSHVAVQMSWIAVKMVKYSYLECLSVDRQHAAV